MIIMDFQLFFRLEGKEKVWKGKKELNEILELGNEIIEGA